MSEKIFSSVSFIQDVGLFTQSLPCQLILANMKPQSIPDTLTNNQNLHAQTIEILADTISESCWDHAIHDIYGDGLYTRLRHKPWLERVVHNGQTILGYGPWWNKSSTKEYSNLLTEVVVNTPKILDKYGTPAWTLYLDLLPNWDRPLKELPLAVISILKT